MKKQKSSSDWKVEFKKSAAKELRKLPQDVKKCITDKIETVLANDPYVGDKLSGNFAGLWKYRISEYRVIYEIHKNILLILVVKIADRKDAYSLPS